MQTLGDLKTQGWIVRARCPDRKRDGLKMRRHLCYWTSELDLDTLLVTRGKGFPLSKLRTVVMCPRCGRRDLDVVFLALADPSREYTVV